MNKVYNANGFRRARKTFTPVCEGVAVQVDPQKETASGIQLPDNLKSGGYTSPIGTVIAVGPAVKQIKVGDRVVFGNAPMHCVCLPGEPELVVTTENHIVGVLDS